MSDNGLIGYRILAAAIIIRAMKDSAGKTTGSSQGRVHLLHGRNQTQEEIKAGAETWLRESTQCAVYLDWLDWNCSGAELADLAKDGMRWHLVTHTLSHVLVGRRG
jgi:hypothetical protein